MYGPHYVMGHVQLDCALVSVFSDTELVHL